MGYCGRFLTALTLQKKLMKRIAIVEDDSKIRETLIAIIENSDKYRCVAAYPSAEIALDDIVAKNPDMVLMDINLPGINGIECTFRLKTLLPHVLVMMLTVYEDQDKIFQSLQAGAVGYLLKLTRPDELMEALNELSAGGSPMTASIARKVVQSFQQMPKVQSQPLNTLTPREDEVINLLSQGFLYKEIAARLSISPNTVHNHIRSIYEKLQVQSRTEAVVKYLSWTNQEQRC